MNFRCTHKPLLNGLFIVLLTSVYPLLAQDTTKLSVEWIYSAERRQVTAMPKHAWLNDGTAIVYDRQKPKAERTLEKLNPQTGERKPLIDTQKALSSLKKYLKDASPDYLAWPDEIAKTGQFALYFFDDDLFVLDLEESTFRRLTETDAKEKSARFSPDANKIAFVRENDLYAYDVSHHKEIRLSRDGSDTILNGTLSWVYWEEIFGRHDIAYWWSQDSKAIAYLHTDQSPVGVMHFVDFKPQTPRLITQRYPKAGQHNPKVKVGIVELEEPHAVWASIDTADYEYIVRVKWLPENRRLSIQTLNREQTELNLYFADRSTGGTQHILTETDEGWVRVNNDLHFLKNRDEFLWVSERSGYAHLYRYTLRGKLVNQLTDGDWALRASGSGQRLDRTVSAVDEENGWVYFTALKKSNIERHLYRIRFDGTDMQRLSQKAGTHRISFSPDARYYFDTYSSDHTPPSFNLHKNDGGLVANITDSRKEVLEQLHLQHQEFFTIEARDGFPLPASLLKPADFDPTHRYPVIVNIYGGPSSPKVTDTWSYGAYFNNILLRNGYLVFEVDNRSSAGIAKKYENKVVNRVMDGVELQDLKDAIDWLKAQSFVDETRIGIWGWSGGGTYTLLAMTGLKDFKAGIAVAPVTDWHYYDTKYTEFAMKRPQENPDGYEKTSLVNHAENLHGRLLLVHGTYDDNVHIQNSWAFANQLIEHNILFDMMIYPMRKHGIGDNPARIHLFNKMLEFWKRNL